jgi:hypothetical protein
MNKVVLFSGKDLSCLVDYNSLINSKNAAKVSDVSKRRVEQVFDSIGGIRKDDTTIEEFISRVGDSMSVHDNNEKKELVNKNLAMPSPKH